jgi:hypothetical protein
MLTNHTKISLHSNLSLNGASRASIQPCAPLLSCVRVFYHMGVFSSIIMECSKKKEGCVSCVCVSMSYKKGRPFIL